MTDSLGIFILVRIFLIVIFTLIWGVISTWFITPKALTGIATIEVKIFGANRPQNISSIWGLLVVFGVIIGINLPAVLLIMKFSFWLADQVH